MDEDMHDCLLMQSILIFKF